MRFVVQGHSMEPTFREGQTLLVSEIPYVIKQPQTGDVVVINDPRDPSTGSTSSPQAGSGQAGRLLLKRITRIEKGKFFVTGDDPKASTDSRMFGPISKKHILGKVIMKL